MEYAMEGVELQNGPYSTAPSGSSKYTVQTIYAGLPVETGFEAEYPIVHEGFEPIQEEIQYEDLEQDGGLSVLPLALREQIERTHILPNGRSHDVAMEDAEDEVASRTAGGESLLQDGWYDANRRSVDPDYTFSDDERSVDENIDEDILSEDEDAAGRGRRGGRRGRGSRGRASRGRGSARGRGRGASQTGSRASQPGRGRRGGRPPRGEGQRGGVKGKRGPRAGANPGAEYMRIQGLAADAYVAGNWDQALAYAEQAVKINPDMLQSHSLKSEIFERMGRPQDAADALFIGAHTVRSTELWKNVAERLRSVGGGDERALNQKISYCYSKIISIDPDDHETRAKRLEILLQLNHLRNAIRECEMILRSCPDDITIVTQLAQLYVADKQPQKAVDFFEQVIARLTKDEEPETSLFDWGLLNVYVDLIVLNDTEEEGEKHDRGLNELKKWSRWLLGRKEETFWDEFADDREWDLEHSPRRTAVSEFVPGKHPLNAYGQGLPIELRIRMGIFQLRRTHPLLDEALEHFESLDPEDDSADATVLTHDDLFREVADALREKKHYQEAVRFYEPLGKAHQTTDPSFYLSAAESYKAIGWLEHLALSYQSYLQFDDTDVSHRIELAKTYVELKMPDHAVQIADEVVKLGRRDLVTAAQLESTIPDSFDDAYRVAAAKRKLLSKETTSKPSLEDPKERTNTIKSMYEQMNGLKSSMDAGDDQAMTDWMILANTLIEEFRQTKVFYPNRNKYIKYGEYKPHRLQGRHNRHGGVERNTKLTEMLAMAQKLRKVDGVFEQVDPNDLNVTPDDFRGISFDDWVDIFCRYAVSLAKRGQARECWPILHSMQEANIFFEGRRLQHLHVCWLTCALLLHDERQVCDEIRWFMRHHPYASEPYRLYSLVNRVWRGSPRTWYNSGPSQKYFLRLIKEMDFSLLDPKIRRTFEFSDQERSSWSGSGKSLGNRHGLVDHDPALITLYAHVMAAGGSYPNALNYYFRAYALRPDDPALNLSIAVAYVHHALKRTAENRQYQIQQGIAFLFRYHELRTKDNIAVHCQEAEFNVGRMWHTLGLNNLALQSYEKCLQLSDRVRKEPRQAFDEAQEDVEDFATEAAYAIQNILAANEDFLDAREVTKKWLII
ncbi:transcription factor TFIIIC subunit tfc4 [Coniosporium tulheliwenetii]|uniref:Transcription factor TFIIIC subunit tfc4 n=1 Tax=Coniosporium tulheliwenetii TaxID=3383036 RepID=A0ACC2ZI38_9PEZI|nr:transcription factor TFIIIC subunit tfc4 [Cladosporium sp. JES 115]